MSARTKPYPSCPAKPVAFSCLLTGGAPCAPRLSYAMLGCSDLAGKGSVAVEGSSKEPHVLISGPLNVWLWLLCSCTVEVTAGLSLQPCARHSRTAERQQAEPAVARFPVLWHLGSSKIGRVGWPVPLRLRQWCQKLLTHVHSVLSHQARAAGQGRVVGTKPRPVLRFGGQHRCDWGFLVIKWHNSQRWRQHPAEMLLQGRVQHLVSW